MYGTKLYAGNCHHIIFQHSVLYRITYRNTNRKEQKK